jgi:hypothetical protein
MKLGDLRKVFEAAAIIYGQAGDEAAAEALKEISGLSSGRDIMTVAAFTKLIPSRQVNGSEAPRNIQSESRSSALVSELRAILKNVEQLFTSAGAKTAAKDIQIFLDMLKSYSDLQVDKACTTIKYSLSQPAAKPTKRTKKPTTTAFDENTIHLHLAALRDAGTDEEAFYLAFKKLKASKVVKLAELAEIAHQFSLSVEPYKTKAAAHSDIEDAFVRQARFENKLR